MTDLDTVKTITEPEKFAGDALIEWVTASHTAIYTALVDARPEREVWTWTGQNQNVEWVRRRMAQETAVHRWDAAHAVGQPDDDRRPRRLRRHRRVPQLLHQRQGHRR